MKLEEAINKLEELSQYESVVEEHEEAISTILQELEHLQKENEELKDIDLTIVHLKGVADEKDRWRNKIREKIELWKPKIEETDKKVEEAQTQEERVVLKCIGIRLDERIKTLQDLLKEE